MDGRTDGHIKDRMWEWTEGLTVGGLKVDEGVARLTGDWTEVSGW